MADLVFSGTLDLGGPLDLVATGGTVKVDGNDMLVQLPNGGKAHSSEGIPVIQPPQSPIDTGKSVWVFKTFNSQVTVAGIPIVALGLTMQGNGPGIWPGMVLPSANKTLTIGAVPINVQGDSSVTLPNGGSAKLDTSGQ